MDTLISCACTRKPMPLRTTEHCTKEDLYHFCAMFRCAKGHGFSCAGTRKNPSMNLTHKEAKALGLAHLWPTVAPNAPGDGMNKLERAFWEQLQTAQRAMEFRFIWREPVVLRLAGRTTYKPDFVSCTPLNHLTFWEVKGYMRDDAAVKLKVAASQFPCFQWVLVQRKRGLWQCRDVTDRGIGTQIFNPF